MAQYDPTIIQKYADELYRQASAVIGIFTVTGAIIGIYLGYGSGPTRNFMTNQVDYSKPILFAIIGGGIAGVIGYMIGTVKAFAYKVQAQTILCQAQIEKNTRK